MQKLLILLIASSFMNCLAWIILIPVFQYPDEQAHFSQIQDIAELGKVPESLNTSREIAITEEALGTDRVNLGNNKFTYNPNFNIEYTNSLFGTKEDEIKSLDKSERKTLVKRESTGNPPLYYFLGSLSYKIFSGSDIFTRIYAVRFYSAFIFLVLVYLSYQISNAIFGKKSYLPIILALLISFKPMLVFASTGVLPDVLTNTLFTAILLFSLLILKNGFKPRYLFYLIIIFILGLITRQQFIISLPIIFSAIILHFILFPKTLRQLILVVLIPIVTILLAIFVPYMKPMLDFSFPEINRPDYKLLLSPDFIAYLKSVAYKTYNETFAWYWGVYRWLSYTQPLLYYKIIKIIIIFSVIGIILKCIRSTRPKRPSFEVISVIFLTLASIIYFAVLIVWDYFFRLDHGYTFGLQGRYLFPLVVAHLSIILFGFKELLTFFSNRIKKLSLIILPVIFILFNDLSLLNIASTYYQTSSLKIFIIQASQYKPFIFKGPTIIIFLLLSLFSQFVLIKYYAKAIMKNNESI